MIDLCCPRCGRIRHVADEYLGRLLECGGCGHIITVVQQDNPYISSRLPKEQISDNTKRIISSRTKYWAGLRDLQLFHLSKKAKIFLLLGLIGLVAIYVALQQQDRYEKTIDKQVAQKSVSEHKNDDISEQNIPSSTSGDNQTIVQNGMQIGTNTNPFDYSRLTDRSGLDSQDNNRANISSPPKPRRDIGVDLAIPTSSKVSLLDGHESNSSLIRVVSEHDVLVLLERVPQDGWYNVIDVQSGKEGWVKENDVKISLTKHPMPQAKFTENYVGSDSAPDVVVMNQTSGDLNLKVEGTFYTLSPHAQLAVSVPAGTFSYYATEPGVMPAQGKQEFKRGYSYTWKFWIETSYVKYPLVNCPVSRFWRTLRKGGRPRISSAKRACLDSLLRVMPKAAGPTAGGCR